MRTLAILTSLVLLSSILLVIPDATAQQSSRRMLAVLEAQGKIGCEVWIINDFLYKPVRINLTHEEAKQSVVIDSEDPEAKVFWDGSPETFQLVTKSNGRHTIELVLDYQVEHDEPRQVFFQVFAKDNTLMMDGNWMHTGQTFCKVIDFFTNQAPEEITPEQIQEENNKFNADFRKDTSLKFSTIETALLILLIVISIVGITSTMYFVIILIYNRSMARVAKRPVKKLDEMITKVRKLAEVMKLQLQLSQSTDQVQKEKIFERIDQTLYSLLQVSASTQKKIEISEALPSPSTMISPSGAKKVLESPPNDTKTKVQKPINVPTDFSDKPNTPEQEKINEESTAELYGVKPEEPSVSFADLETEETPEPQIVVESAELKPEPQIVVESAELKPEPVVEPVVEQEVEPDSSGDTIVPNGDEVIEMDLDDVTPCFSCGVPPEYHCKDCKNNFCAEHESHNCKDKKKKSGATKLVGKIKNKLSKKDIQTQEQLLLSSDSVMDEMLKSGRSRRYVMDILVKEYLKIPYHDSRTIYDDLNKQFAKDPTYPLTVRIHAMMERLIESDT